MKVLVVEDEWLVRELIVGELLDAGFDVVEAESGEAALARYHEHQSGRALHRHPIAGANRRLGCSRALSRIELPSPGGLRNRLLSDRASPRSRSRLNQQAVHLCPRHRCDQARHEPLFGRAALRAFRPLATTPSACRNNFRPHAACYARRSLARGSDGEPIPAPLNPHLTRV